MTYSNYRDLFDHILENPSLYPVYSENNYFDYVKLNISRHDRWIKKGILSDSMVALIKAIDKKQTWILITEPWCGDAAHCTPFIQLLAELNPKIDLQVQLRDTDSEIENYLTKGAKSIPVLIVRDENQKDLFTWGPRPALAQNVHLKNLDSTLSKVEQKIELQNWYNENKGQALQSELEKLFILSLQEVKV
ncbi:MAG: thioredoxin family protein [Bacteroidetes bacterium]|nr:thioredoxin family protein [Bacteroidota bacterium]